MNPRKSQKPSEARPPWRRYVPLLVKAGIASVVILIVCAIWDTTAPSQVSEAFCAMTGMVLLFLWGSIIVGIARGE